MASTESAMAPMVWLRGVTARNTRRSSGSPLAADRTVLSQTPKV